VVFSGQGGWARAFTFDNAGALQGGTPVEPFAGRAGVSRGVSADVNGDGVTDWVYVTGPGAGGWVRIIDGANGNDLLTATNFEPYAGEEFTTIGLFVAAGDLDGDGRAEIVVSPDQGGGARIQVLRWTNGTLAQVGNFFGIDDPAFRGGGRIAVGDVNGDNRPDLIVGAGFGGGPRVALFDGRDLTGNVASPRKLVGDFLVFEPGLRDGVFVAAGDLSGDGRADLVFGGGPGGGPRVYALDGSAVLTNLAAAQATPWANFFAFDANQRGGVRVAVKDADGDNQLDLLVSSGDNVAPAAKLYRGPAIAAAANGQEPTVGTVWTPFEQPSLATGVFVG
jgi:hypothetical protein